MKKSYPIGGIMAFFSEKSEEDKKITVKYLLIKKIVVPLHRNFAQILKINTMYLDQEKKKEIFGTYGKSNTDTGSPEAQIALFSYRIAHLTEHLKVNKKDHTTQRALKMLVGKRRRLLDYLIRTDISRYRALIAKKELGIRK